MRGKSHTVILIKWWKRSISVEYIYIPNVFLVIPQISSTSMCTGYANPHVYTHTHTHTHTQTMPTDLINLHLILLRKERRLEMRSVYLQWYWLLVTNEHLWLLVLAWYFVLTMFGWELNTVMEERQRNVCSCSNSSAPEWVDAMRHNNACNHRN